MYQALESNVVRGYQVAQAEGVSRALQGKSGALSLLTSLDGF